MDKPISSLYEDKDRIILLTCLSETMFTLESLAALQLAISKFLKVEFEI